MKSRRRRSLATAAISVLFFFSGFAGAAETSGPGVVVEEVERGSALEKGGLRPGDFLFSWERRPEAPASSQVGERTGEQGGEGEIRTVFDWLGVKAEQAPRGALRLHGERAGMALSLEIPKGSWDSRARPRMAADLLQAYEEGRRRIGAGDLEGGIALWAPLLQPGDPRAAPGLGCWILLEAGEAWSKAGRGDKARDAWQKALAVAPDAQARVMALEALGKSYEVASEMDRAEASYRSALEAGEAAWGDSLRVARTLNKWSNVLRLRNRLDESERLQGRALEIQQRWAAGIGFGRSVPILAGGAILAA